MNRIGNILYRPTENHVGVIYRFGRFHRFVDPDHWAGTLPWFETVEKESKLDMRTVQLSLADVYTHERVPVNVEFKAFYLVDLRLTEVERRLQALRFPTEQAWDEIVRTAINDVARNSIFIAKTFDELNSKAGRSYLKSALSEEIASRVRGFGILINPRFGVNVVNLQPNEEFRKALMEESAAGALGSAAVSRLKPLIEQFIEQKQEKAVYALVMQIASAVAKHGNIPDVIFPNSNDYPGGGIAQGNGQGSIFPNSPGFPATPGKPRSIAGD